MAGLLALKKLSKFWKNSLCLPQFYSLTGCNTVSSFFKNIFISKTCVFQRLLKDTSAAHLIEQVGESTTVNEDLKYHVMSFIQKIRIMWKN